MSLQEHKRKTNGKIWGPELILIFVLPIVLIAAIVITVSIASDHRFTPSQDGQIDRFGRTLEPKS